MSEENIIPIKPVLIGFDLGKPGSDESVLVVATVEIDGKLKVDFSKIANDS